MKKVYFIMSVLVLIGFTSFGQTNYLSNGNFENDFQNWTFGAANGSAVTYSIETANPISGAKSAKLQITGKGVNPWDAYLDNRITLHKGKSMKVSFKAKASAPTFINFEVGQNYPDFIGLVRENNVAIGTTVQTYSYTFTPSFSDSNMKINFMAGNVDAGVTIWLDDVVIEEVGTQWDGNIIPNGEFNEFSVPVAADAFPDWRRKKLAFSNDAPANGGWEGGWMEGAPNDIIFDIDETGKLSGPNSAHIRVNSKVNDGFFNGIYTVFFQANGGVAYDLSFDVIASQNVTFRVAMNRFPFELADQYPLVPDMFSIPVTATTTKQTITVKSTPLPNSQMYQVFFAGLPAGGPYDIWIDNVKLTGPRTTTSLSKDVQQTRFTVYPNPTASGLINLDVAGLALEKSFNVSVYTLAGSKVLDKNFSNASLVTLDTKLSKGLYLVKVQDAKNSLTQKLVVE